MTKLTIPPQPKSKDELRRSINIRQVLIFLGHSVNEHSMACCPFHQDSSPSLWVNDEFAWCYACSRGWDIFDLISETYQISFVDAMNWLRDHEEELGKVTFKAKSRARGEYRGPVDPYIVCQWHLALRPEHYDYYRTCRGLTKETVDLYQLGWREDFKAYVIPFWRGVPQQSEIDIVQFRRTNASPAWFESKFIGLAGHNRPSFINTHLLRTWGVIVFGSFDALLAGQDGLPAVSPNGVSTFCRKTTADRLNAYFKDVKRLYVVKDSTPSEDASVEKLVALLQVPDVQVKCFPEGQGKDYGDYRLGGHSVVQFIEEVLGVVIS